MSATEWMTTTATVYRNPTGIADGMTAQGTVQVMPLMPLGAELIERLGLNALREPWQTFAANVDIQEGDELGIGATRYMVRWVGTWPWAYEDEVQFVHVVVEQRK